MSVVTHIAKDKFRRASVGIGKAMVWFAVGALTGIIAVYRTLTKKGTPRRKIY